MRALTVSLLVALATAPFSAWAQTAPPVSKGPKNAPFQQPSFQHQTRAPGADKVPTLDITTVATNLPRLWAMEFLPDGHMLVTTKAGALHIVDRSGGVGPAIDGVPQVDARGQGGLLDVALSPDFGRTGIILFSYAEPRGGGANGTSVARATLRRTADGGGTLRDLTIIFRQTPAYRGTKHFGSRLAFAPDGTLFITTGERSDSRVRGEAQNLNSGLGKVMRINPDGSVPADNPFVGQAGVQPQIWSYGHRNPQSAVVTAAGDLWTVEHGPRGGDELNRPKAGLNYGWPVITRGVNYSGSRVGDGLVEAPGMEQPIYYWDPVIAPSGMDEYTSNAIEEWQGALLVGGLVAGGLVVLHLEGDRVIAEERVPLRARIRDVRVGPDGAVYALT
ncbi:MAG: PQQ-dependent sugar dehydrogenase, partial [Pseudomonadota bacterium]